MSRLTTGILSVFTLSLISSAAQFALGRDLSPTAHDSVAAEQGSAEQVSPSSFTPPASETLVLVINRGAKADRASGRLGSPAQTRTVSLSFSGYSDTTFLLRVPVAEANPRPRSQAKPPSRRQMVACEPVVSVLTEVAKQLQPGRCVT
jgi:hypothetical protein